MTVFMSISIISISEAISDSFSMDDSMPIQRC